MDHSELPSGLAGRLLRNRDFYAGAFMMVIGLGATVIAPGYGMGTMMRMGSGFFPTMLGVAMMIIGATIIVTGVRPKTKGEEEEEDILNALPAKMDWRGWSCVLGGPIAFVILGDHFGLIPGAFGCVFVSALGDRNSTLKGALILAICVSLIGAFLFSYLMQMPFPILIW